MRTLALRLLALVSTLALVLPATAQAPPLDPLTQPHFINPLPRPAVATPLPAAQWIDGVETYRLAMTEFQQDLGLYDPVTGAPMLTTVWGYGGSFPGPTIEARTGTPIKVWWENDLPPVHLLPVDPTLTLDATHTWPTRPARPGRSPTSTGATSPTTATATRRTGTAPGRRPGSPTTTQRPAGGDALVPRPRHGHHPP